MIIVKAFSSRTITKTMTTMTITAMQKQTKIQTTRQIEDTAIAKVLNLYKENTVIGLIDKRDEYIKCLSCPIHLMSK